jgi:hypothetical protein
LQSLWHTTLNAFLDSPFAVLFGILAQLYPIWLSLLAKSVAHHVERLLG